MAGGLLVGSQLGSYRIDAVIAAGPASIVYRATHVRLATAAAVKVLASAAAGDDASRARFLREMELAASIDHPGVIPIIDMDVHEGAPYVVMRHVAGGDLKALLARRGALAPERVSAVLGPVAGALDAAHARGLVHGGVRPSNVLLQWSGDGALERVYLTDFAMAGRESSAVDRFDYLAPEQAEGGELTPAADVYGLGCVVYHAMTGRAPFSASFGTMVRHAQLSEGVEAPSAVRHGLPDAVDDPVLRAMDKDPQQRFGSCGALMAAVGAALDGEAAPAARAAAERTAASAPPFTATPAPEPTRPPAPASEPTRPPPPIAAPPPEPTRPPAPPPVAAPPPEPTRPPAPPPVAAPPPEPTRPPAPPPVAAPPPEPTRPPAPSPPPATVMPTPPEPTVASSPAPLASSPAPPAAPPPAAPPPSATRPPEPEPARAASGPPPAGASRGRRRMLTVTIPVIVCTIVAAGLGYTLSTLGGDDEGGGDGAAATTPRASAAQAASGLSAITERSLPDLRCTVTPAPGGGQVVANAGCVPKTAGTPPIERVTLTLFSDKAQMDRLYDSSRALAGDAAAGGAGCAAGPWFRDAARSDRGGRRFCSAAPPGARIVWTADDALVLADAGATNAGALERWWADRRDLRPAQDG